MLSCLNSGFAAFVDGGAQPQLTAVGKTPRPWSGDLRQGYPAASSSDHAPACGGAESDVGEETRLQASAQFFHASDGVEVRKDCLRLRAKICVGVGCSCYGNAAPLHARSLGPLVKARAFGMTPQWWPRAHDVSIRQNAVIPTVAVFQAEGGIWRGAAPVPDS